MVEIMVDKKINNKEIPSKFIDQLAVKPAIPFKSNNEITGISTRATEFNDKTE
jgi:hypothetical protein